MKNLKKKISLATISISIIFLISFFFFFKGLASPGFFYPGLNCSLGDGSCSSGVCVFSLNKTTNSHAGDCNYDNWKVCCEDSFVFLNSYIQNSDCDANDGGVLKLNQLTNSHAENYTKTNYDNRVCLGSSSGSIYCTYKDSCDATETSPGSLDKSTDSHVSGSDDYPIKICCGYSVKPCIFNITYLEPPLIAAEGELANVTVNVTNIGESTCNAYVECELEDPSNNHHFVWESCPEINPDETHTFKPSMIIDEMGSWSVIYCSVNASFDATCGTLLTHDIYWLMGTFEGVTCAADDNCYCHQKCDVDGSITGTSNTCYNFTTTPPPGLVGCDYYDSCLCGYNATTVDCTGFLDCGDCAAGGGLAGGTPCDDCGGDDDLCFNEYCWNVQETLCYDMSSLCHQIQSC